MQDFEIVEFGILKNWKFIKIQLCELFIHKDLQSKSKKNLALFAVKNNRGNKIIRYYKKIKYELRKSKGYCSEISSGFI